VPLIKEIYKSRLGGYIGIAKIIAKIKYDYDFLYLRKEVKIFVDEYDICLRLKVIRYKLYGLL
jgi:hypothetical protein